MSSSLPTPKGDVPTGSFYSPKQRRDTQSNQSQQGSIRSPSYNEDVLANFALEEQLECESSSNKIPQAKLSRMLSVRSIISTASSFATRRKLAQANGVVGLYRSIGAGTCGIVYEELGTINAIKLAKANNSQLWNDYQFHTLVVEKFAATPFASRESLSIPKCLWFASRDDKAWWNEHLHRFPDQARVMIPRDVLCTERILPLPKELRHAIIDQWCPKALNAKAKAEKTNQDCLVRIYLGRRQTPRSRPLSMFQLRNFNLWVDMIHELNIAQFGDVAETMGLALGVLHWSVGTDARDVEFVLGSAPTPTEIPLTYAQIRSMPASGSTWKQVKKHNFRRRAVRLWLLDFNQCQTMTRGGAGIAMAVRAFYENDPYFPRPHGANSFEEDLWRIFRTSYEKAGAWALRDASEREKALPIEFIAQLVVEQQSRMAKQAEAMSRLAADAYEEKESSMTSGKGSGT